jgi:hypothetical protein
MVNTLFIGLDPTGAHIYGSYNGRVVSHDVSGFAAIGGGDWHAQSRFMFARHTRAAGLPETLLLTYFAKKRAEVAPGVGTGTDMIWFGPSLGTYNEPDEAEIAGLDRIYQATLVDEQRQAEKAQRSIEAYVDQIACKLDGYPQSPSKPRVKTARSNGQAVPPSPPLPRESGQTSARQGPDSRVPTDTSARQG